MSGVSDIYQRRLVGFTIESRSFDFRASMGAKECRDAQENDCCLEESGESGESGGSEESAPSPYTVETSCSPDSLMPETMYFSFTYGSPVFTNQVITWDGSKWTGIPPDFLYCRMVCGVGNLWNVAVAHSLSGSDEATSYVTPADVSTFDLNYTFTSGGYAGGVVRITSVPQ